MVRGKCNNCGGWGRDRCKCLALVTLPFIEDFFLVFLCYRVLAKNLWAKGRPPGFREGSGWVLLSPQFQYFSDIPDQCKAVEREKTRKSALKNWNFARLRSCTCTFSALPPSANKVIEITDSLCRSISRATRPPIAVKTEPEDDAPHEGSVEAELERLMDEDDAAATEAWGLEVFYSLQLWDLQAFSFSPSCQGMAPTLSKRCLKISNSGGLGRFPGREDWMGEGSLQNASGSEDWLFVLLPWFLAFFQENSPWDDVRDLQFLVDHREKLQGKYDCLVEFGPTAGGTCAYHLDPFGVPVVATINDSTKNLGFLDGHDWLANPGNPVLVTLWVPSLIKSFSWNLLHNFLIGPGLLGQEKKPVLCSFFLMGGWICIGII